MQELAKFMKGQTVIASRGEYLDYYIDFIFNVTTDFYLREQILVWSALTGFPLNEDKEPHPYPGEFSEKWTGKSGHKLLFQYLEEYGFIERVEYRELGCGDYLHVNYSDK